MTVYKTLGDSADAAVALAVKLHEAIVGQRPDSWRGVSAKENMVKQAMYGVLHNVDEVVRLYPIVFAQQEF